MREIVSMHSWILLLIVDVTTIGQFYDFLDSCPFFLCLFLSLYSHSFAIVSFYFLSQAFIYFSNYPYLNASNKCDKKNKPERIEGCVERVYVCERERGRESSSPELVLWFFVLNKYLAQHK